MSDEPRTGLDRIREAIRKDRGDNPTADELRDVIEWLNSASCCGNPGPDVWRVDDPRWESDD